MSLEIKLCECGCGNPAPIAKATVKRYGHIKGLPCRFIRGHILKTLSKARVKGEKHPCWKGGKIINYHGYELTKNDNHPRANSWGYVPTHILNAEKAFGKPLPPMAVTHHFPNKTIFTYLVICQNNSYHHILHRRYRAFKACGHANWRKCYICKKYDDPQNLSLNKRSGNYHKSCIRPYRKGKHNEASLNLNTGQDPGTH